ncbi:hypothetical protein [Luteimonas sp. FCS-9]|uniref:hypothetical protein n=1 Tax=Luteimonas sp. FCS-9 TaxID=1547516 RepID=UPI00063E9031|nr:hypothetical protein [Luteimonas sp. FCS-9]KLI99077.1 membrane protein [Luteimonas sp. FCS-9]
MIVPEYWAEARRHGRHAGHRVTVRRFGWSDEGQAQAQAHAEARVQEAFDAVLAGESRPLRERLTNYGFNGVPIREEIVERVGDAVITRNSYGALCLNTPDVLFADVDFEPRPSGCALSLVAGAAVWGAAFVVGIAFVDPLPAALAAFVALFLANAVSLAVRRRAFARGGGPEGGALARIEAFAQAHPDWHLRVYRTPAGLRVLVLHRTFSPCEPDVALLFQALQADRLYSSLCRLQHCFRARVSPKPWRIGIVEHIRPRSAAWSREHARLPERLAWIDAYARRSQGFAACRYLRTLGDAAIDPKAGRVMDLHDALARAHAPLPLA